jgi:hypothetical protein
LKSVAAALLLLGMPAAAQLPPPSWEAHVHELAPALRACLADRPGGMVISAWPMNQGKAGARVLLPGGAREDCIADLGRGRVEQRTPVAVEDRRQGEGLRAFMLDRRCVDAWRVDDAAGRGIGWLAYPDCG